MRLVETMEYTLETLIAALQRWQKEEPDVRLVCSSQSEEIDYGSVTTTYTFVTRKEWPRKR